MKNVKILVSSILSILLITIFCNISYAATTPDPYDPIFDTNPSYYRSYTPEERQKFMNDVQAFKDADYKTAAIGKHLLAGYTTLRGTTELYCLEHYHKLQYILRYTVTDYIEIQGSTATNLATGTQTIDDSNIIMALILSRYENRYSKSYTDKTFTDSQKALWMYIYEWLQTPAGASLNRTVLGLDDVYPSTDAAAGKTNEYGSTVGGIDIVNALKNEVAAARAANDLAKYNKIKIKMYFLKHQGAMDAQYLMIAIPEVVADTELIIDKRDAETDNGLTGVTFRIKNVETGEYIGFDKKQYVMTGNPEPIFHDTDNKYTIVDPDNAYTTNANDAYAFSTGLTIYKKIHITGLKPGQYLIEEIGAPPDYKDSIGTTWTTIVRDKQTNEIKLYNFKEIPEEPEIGSGSGNITISGTVWEDEPSGKKYEGDSQKGDSEKGVEGVKVYWKKADGTLIANTTTGSDGSYSMKSTVDCTVSSSCSCGCSYHYKLDEDDVTKIKNSYIEFEYNGLKYITVAASNNISSTTSIVKELSATRNILDNRFAEITSNSVKNDSEEDQYSLSYNTNVDADGDGEKDFFAELIQNNTDFAVRANTKMNGISDLWSKKECTETKEYHTSCSCDYDSPEWDEEKQKWTGGGWDCTHYNSGQKEVAWKIENMNMGLALREQPDLALTSDIEEVRVIMKNQEYTYKYNARGITSPDLEELYDYKVKFSDKYEESYQRPINPSDIEYVNDKGTEELQVYVLYKIVAKNQSTTLPVMVKEIVNYYDANYTVKSRGWNNTSKYGKNYSSNGYKAAYTQELEGLILQPGEISDAIEIEFRVKDDTVKDLIDGSPVLLKNISEIHTYSTFYGKDTVCSEYETAEAKGKTNNRYAGIDIDSGAGNAKPGKLSTYEDDTDQAPTFVLFKDPNYKIISGTVYEDKSISTDGQRIGNGIFDGTENRVENVKVELLRVLDNGTTELAKLYCAENNPSIADAVIETDSNGAYSFTGIVVDDYIIRYTYGNRTVDVDANNVDRRSDEEDQSILNSGKQTKINGNIINARNYKSTVIKSEPLATIMKGNSANVPDEQWHLTTRDNASVAVDYLEKRKAISDLQYSNFDTPINMTAYTKPFSVQLEYTEEQINDMFYDKDYYDNTPADALESDDILVIEGESYDDDIAFEHEWSMFDFGIIERPREDIVADKTIENIKITLANGQILTEGNPYLEKLNYVKALGTTDVKTRDRAAASRAKFLFIEMDSELIQGARLDILYKITVTNNSEIDYEYDYGYKYNYNYNYNDNEFDQHITTDNKAYYYYYGDTKNAKVIQPTVDLLVDYMDPELTCTVGTEISRDDINKVNEQKYTYKENEQAQGEVKYNWTQIKPSTNADGTTKRPAEQLSEQGLISDQTKEIVDKENYLVFTTNYFYDVTRGTSKSLNIFASKLLANQAEEYTYENHVEILKIGGKIARNIDKVETDGKQVTKLYKPGNYIPSLSRIGTTSDRTLEQAGFHEQDDEMITVRITPPTGLDNNAIIYISVGLIGLIVVAGGIYFIKKRIIG